MGQLATLLYKNVLLLRRVKYEAVMVLACCILLPVLSSFTANTSAFRKYDRTDATKTYEIPFFYGSNISFLFLYATPNTSAVRSTVGIALKVLNFTGLRTIPVFFNDSVAMAEELKRQYKAQIPTPPHLRRRGARPFGVFHIGVEFANLKGPEYVYYIRANGDVLPFTDRLFVAGESKKCYGLVRCPVAYGTLTRAVHVQLAINQALMYKITRNEPMMMPGLEFWQFPIQPTVYMPSLFPVMSLVMPITFALIPLFRYTVSKLVEEKECSMKQLLVVMGMQMHTFFISWFIIFFGVVLVLSGIMTIILRVGQVITQSTLFFFFVNLAHSLCIFAVSFVISTLFTKTRSASVFATFACLIMSMMYMVVPFTRQEGYPFEYGVPMAVICLLMVSPTFTYALAVDLIFFAEIFRDGIHGEVMFTLGQIPAIWLIIVLTVSFFFYSAIGFALERTLSPEYGDRPSWLSFLKPKVAAPNQNTITYPDEDYETPIDNWRPMIRITDVWKVFKQARKEVVVAVRGLTLDIFDAQITCILGHNGAGKSTLVGMMTRLLRPTAGKITFCDSSAQQGSIGICLQSNTHYKSLTVREQLKILAKLKNLAAVDEAIDRVLQEVGLLESSDKACSNLSGGQQRRLNVAIALIGDPKVIFLDEPTTGVDPLSRRAIWQILQSRRSNHCIVLTTHYMDEADILADRKAIVSQGSLRCTGSSLFLKNRFGAGYHLNVELRDELAESKLASCKLDVLQFVRTCVPDASVREETRLTISVTLPFKNIQAFPKLFSQLEAFDGNSHNTTFAHSLGMRTYGIELTTLEEVFLKLASEGSEEVSARLPASSTESENAALFINASHGGNRTPTTTGNANSEALSRVHALRNLLAESQQLSAVRKWFIMLLLRLHMMLNARVGTAVMILLGPLLVFSLVCMFASVFVKLINFGCNTRRLVFDPLLYVAGTADNQSSLPPFVFDNAPNLFINGSLFKETMNELDVQLAPINNFTFGNNLGSSIDTNAMKLRVWYRDTALHSPPIALSVMSNFLLRLYDEKKSIKTINAPIGINMPALAANDSANDNPSASLPISVDQLLVVLPLGIAVIYVVTAARLHTEFTCGALNQLRCTGVSGAYYWSVQLVADSVQYSLSSTLSALAVVFASWLFGADVQYDSDVIECQVLAIFIFMPVSLLLLYVTVLLLRNSSAALVGFCATLIFFVLPSASNGLLQSQLVSDDPKNSFPMYYRALLLFPNTLLYCAFAALKYPTIVDPSGTYEFADYFKPENQFVWFCVAGVSHTIILTIAVLLLHKHFLEKHASIFGQPRERQTSSNTEYLQVDTHTRDSDVVAEEQTINNLVTSGFSDGREAGDLPALVCHNLTLTYNSCKFKRCCCTKKTKTAVNSLTMSATNSQIFGLLGPNGAGKTSTLKVVAGSERATLGTVFVGGKPIASMPLAQLFDKVSVCTQDDSLWPMLTIRDHLNYYARLRGFQGSTRKQLVDLLIELLEIGGHAHKRCEQLSGGTKRKVVFAISMLRTSRMRLILCDEPTSGLDPQSKRVIWNLLMALFRGESQCACVFTSHSMEEVEAVCDRIGIMINGELHCLGTIQNCKDKYGGVYCIELKLKSAQGFDRLWPFLHSKFPSAFQCDSYVNTNVRINVPRADVTSLGYAFQVLEETRQDLSYEVEEYSFGQSTLEQVFLDLVKKHGADSID